jgi:multiple sugar transport system permease protein
MSKTHVVSLSRTKARWAYAFLAVPVVFYLSIRVFPSFFAFYLSLTDWDIISSNMDFVGLANYRTMFTDSLFWKTFGNTIRYVVFGLPISMVLGFILAYNIDKLGKSEDLFKSLYFLPYITSLVAISWVWRWFFQPAPVGVFNNILTALSLPNHQFLQSVQEAPFAILATTIWADVGFQMLIFLAGLKGISRQYYEAAQIDGAGNGQLLVHITLPMLHDTMLFLVITGTIRYLRIFTQVLNMTYQGDGGPLNATKPLVLYIYDKGFGKFEMGYASAMTVFLFLFILLITLIQMKVTKHENAS